MKKNYSTPLAEMSLLSNADIVMASLLNVLFEGDGTGYDINDASIWN